MEGKIVEDKKKVLFHLFISTLYLSAFTFGGGYVIVSLLKKKFVDEYHWIENDEMLDLVAIAQSAPGAIAVNGAIVVGYKLAGLIGAFVAVIGAIIPPFVIITILAMCYQAFRDNWLISQMLFWTLPLIRMSPAGIRPLFFRLMRWRAWRSEEKKSTKVSVYECGKKIFLQ